MKQLEVKTYTRQEIADITNIDAKDKNFVYYQNQIIPEADPLTFVVPEDKTYFYTYGKDKNFVFSGIRKVLNIDPDGFEVIDRNYTRNKKFLYWNEELVKDADPATFEEIYYDGRYSYAKDKNYHDVESALIHLGKLHHIYV